MIDIDKAKTLDQVFYESTTLAPPTFFLKKMNVSKDALLNLFYLWRKAIHSFLNESLIHHDALVGENACHIRALALIDFMCDDDLKKNLIHISNKIHEITELLHLVPIMEQDIKGSIQDFLQKHNLIFSVPASIVEQVKFIINSYILTVTKKELPRIGLTLCERTSDEPIKAMGFVKNKAKILISNAQKSLSSASCAYILAEASKLKDKTLSHLLKIKYDAHLRSHLPQFIAGKVLLKQILNKEHVVVIKIHRYLNYTIFDELTICLKSNPSHTEFDLIIDKIPTNSTCIVCVGSVNYVGEHESRKIYLDRLLSHSFIDIFLATFASHPQYAGELKHLPPPFQEAIEELSSKDSPFSSLSTQEENMKIITQIRLEQIDYENKKLYAIEQGCALENPSLLFFNHIYADMIDNHLEKGVFVSAKPKTYFV